MNRFITKIKGLVVVITLLLACPIYAADKPMLNDISFTSSSVGDLMVTLSFSEKIMMPSSFSIDKPARMVFDFENTGSSLPAKTRTVDSPIANSVTAIDVQGRLRVVINLQQRATYSTEIIDNTFIITLKNIESPLEAKPKTAAVLFPGVPSHSGRSVLNVDFHRDGAGAGRVVVQLSDSTTPVDIRAQGDLVLVEIINTSLPDKLARRLDVTDFGTPVQTIDTQKVGENVQLKIAVEGGYEQLVYQTNNSLTVEIKPLSQEQAAAKQKDQPEYTGDRLSLNFQDIDVRAVLQLIADFTGLNMVASDSVKGNVTLRLQNGPWDQALDMILKTKGLGKRQEGNVILVAPSDEIAAREKRDLEALQQVQSLAPLRSDFIQINYAKAANIQALLKDKGNSLLSQRGNVSVDERTNTLLVQDTPENLIMIRELVARLDVPVRQVMIQARIVNATRQFERDLGILWGVSGTSVNNTTRFGTSGNITEAHAEATRQALNPDPTQRLNVNLPTFSTTLNPVGTIGLAIGKIDGDTLLDLELQAAESETIADIVSSPRLLTTNQKEARIKQGEEIPYQQASSSGATTTQFEDAVLQLKVTPQITPDNRIILDLIVTQDVATTTSVQGVPIIDTKEVETQVLVDNGDTVVLGGVLETNKTNAVVRVPFFADLPLVGPLFRSTQVQDTRTELLVFVTPRIAVEELAVDR